MTAWHSVTRATVAGLVLAAICLHADSAAHADDCATLRKTVSDLESSMARHKNVIQDAPTKLAGLRAKMNNLLDQAEKSGSTADWQARRQAQADYELALNDLGMAKYALPVEEAELIRVRAVALLCDEVNPVPQQKTDSQSTTPTSTPPTALTTPTDPTTPTFVTPPDQPGPTDSTTTTTNVPLPPSYRGGIGPIAPASSGRGGNLPPVWCVIYRDIPSMTPGPHREWSVALPKDVPFLEGVWQSVECNLTFPEAHKKRDRLAGDQPGAPAAPGVAGGPTGVPSPPTTPMVEPVAGLGGYTAPPVSGALGEGGGQQPPGGTGVTGTGPLGGDVLPPIGNNPPPGAAPPGPIAGLPPNNCPSGTVRVNCSITGTIWDGRSTGVNGCYGPAGAQEVARNYMDTTRYEQKKMICTIAGAPVGPPPAGPPATAMRASADVGGEPPGDTTVPPVSSFRPPDWRVGDSPECTKARRRYEIELGMYDAIVNRKVVDPATLVPYTPHINRGPMDLMGPEVDYKLTNETRWHLEGYLIQVLLDAHEKLLRVLDEMDYLCGFQIGNKWFPPKWVGRVPKPSDRPPPPRIAVNTPPENAGNPGGGGQQPPGAIGINPLGGDVLPPIGNNPPPGAAPPGPIAGLPPQPPGPATTPPAAGAPGAPGTKGGSCPAGTQDITCTLKYGSESGCLSSQVDIDDLRKRCARNGGTITTGPAPLAVPPPVAVKPPPAVAMKPSTLLPPPALPGAKTKTDSSGLLQPPALPPAASRPEPKTVQQQRPRTRTRTGGGGGQGPSYDPPPDVDWEGLGRELGRALGGGDSGGGDEGHHH
jgi:hypothetical protein